MEDLRLDILDMEQPSGDVEFSQQQELWARHSIYKVPTYLSDLNQTAYKPQVVSFGPYHYEDQQCKPMHEHKVRALCKFLGRSGKSVEPYKRALDEVIDQLMKSYDKLDKEWQDDKNSFLRLMILDGTFMLEILNTATGKYNDYPPNDPIFGAHGKLYNVPFIRRDMLLIENQIPMLVLETLIAVRDGILPEQDKKTQASNSPSLEQQTLVLNESPVPPYQVKGKKTEDAQSSDLQMYACKQSHTPQVTTKTPSSVGDLVLEFFCRDVDDHKKPSLHLLDLYRKSMLSAAISSGPVPKSEDPSCHPLLKCVIGGKSNPPTRGRPSGIIISATELSDEGVEPLEIIRSATELRDAGVRFRKLGTQNVDSINFKNGVLTLPPLVVDDHTESTFLNLMAFERLHVGAGNQIASYICFMDNLIDSALDVAVLHKQGIIQNATGSDKAVASLFNKLSMEVPLDSDSSLDAVNKDVNDYCKQKWNQWRANLLETYFQSPWASISLLAAIFLLLLTVAQTVYSIWDFYRK